MRSAKSTKRKAKNIKNIFNKELNQKNIENDENIFIIQSIWSEETASQFKKRLNYQKVGKTLKIMKMQI